MVQAKNQQDGMQIASALADAVATIIRVACEGDSGLVLSVWGSGLAMVVAQIKQRGIATHDINDWLERLSHLLMRLRDTPPEDVDRVYQELTDGSAPLFAPTNQTKPF